MSERNRGIKDVNRLRASLDRSQLREIEADVRLKAVCSTVAFARQNSTEKVVAFATGVHIGGGLILTTYQCLETDPSLETTSIRSFDGRHLKVERVKSFPEAGLAIIGIEPPSHLYKARFEFEQRAEVGDTVFIAVSYRHPRITKGVYIGRLREEGCESKFHHGVVLGMGDTEEPARLGQGGIGAGVFNSHGNLVGIFSQSWLATDETGGKHIFGASFIPSYNYFLCLDELGSANEN